MRIAICENSKAAAEKLLLWIKEYCVLYEIPATFQCFLSPDSFAGTRERFDVVYMGFGGSSGFYQARLLRERDRACRIVLMDDTQEFVVRCVRLHCTDFILRPVDFRRIVQSLRLALGGRDY